MKKVLWISRHKMTDEQFKDLEFILNDKVKLIVYDKTLNRIQDIEDILTEVDAVCAVLPLILTFELYKYGKPIFQAISERKPTGKFITLSNGIKEQEFAFVHAGWLKISNFQLETQIFKTK